MKRGNLFFLYAGLACICLSLVLFYLADHLGGVKEPLQSYRYSTGGDMEGSSYCERVIRNDEGALYIIESSPNWFSDNTVTEYQMDGKVLDEIQKVFNKYNMKSWHHKEFSNMHVDDGASYSYEFKFEKENVYFTSQIYPKKYGDKLVQIDDIISRYKESAVKLPGLVVDEIDEEQIWQRRNPDNGKVELAVFEYANNRLSFRISNGTEEDIEVDPVITLTKEGKVLDIDLNYPYGMTVYSHDLDEHGITVLERLNEGVYQLTVDQYSCEFEIR